MGVFYLISNFSSESVERAQSNFNLILLQTVSPLDPGPEGGLLRVPVLVPARVHVQLLEPGGDQAALQPELNIL